MSTAAAQGTVTARAAVQALRAAATQPHFDAGPDPLGLAVPLPEQTDLHRAARAWTFAVRERQRADALRLSKRRRKTVSRRRPPRPRSADGEEDAVSEMPSTSKAAAAAPAGPAAAGHARLRDRFPLPLFTPEDWTRAEAVKVDRALLSPRAAVRALRALAADPLALLRYRPPPQAALPARVDEPGVPYKHADVPEASLNEICLIRDVVEGGRTLDALAAVARYREDAYRGSFRRFLFPMACRYANWEHADALLCDRFPVSERLPYDPALSAAEIEAKVRAEGKMGPVGYVCKEMLRFYEWKGTLKALPVAGRAAAGAAKKVLGGEGTKKKRRRESVDDDVDSESDSEAEDRERARGAKKPPTEPKKAKNVLEDSDQDGWSSSDSEGPREKKPRVKAPAPTKPKPKPRAEAAAPPKEKEKEKDKDRGAAKPSSGARPPAPSIPPPAAAAAPRPAVNASVLRNPPQASAAAPVPLATKPLLVLFEGMSMPTQEDVRTEFRNVFDVRVHSITALPPQRGFGYRVLVDEVKADGVVRRFGGHRLFHMPAYAHIRIEFDGPPGAEGPDRERGRGGGLGGQGKKRGRDRNRDARNEFFRDRGFEDRDRGSGAHFSDRGGGRPPPPPPPSSLSYDPRRRAGPVLEAPREPPMEPDVGYHRPSERYGGQQPYVPPGGYDGYGTVAGPHLVGGYPSTGQAPPPPPPPRAPAVVQEIPDTDALLRRLQESGALVESAAVPPPAAPKAKDLEQEVGSALDNLDDLF